MLLALLAVQDASLDAFYKFKPGSTWSYDRVEKDAKRTVSARAVGEENGRMKIDWQEHNADGSLHEAEDFTWFVKDDVLRVEVRNRNNGGVFEVPLLKAGVKKGEKWSNPEGESTFLGPEEIKVPAATYKDALHVRLNLGAADPPIPIDIYLVPKVGLVKVSITSDEGPNSFELTEFKEAK